MSDSFGPVRRIVLAAALAASAALFASDVLAQSASCPGLIATLKTLERNGDYRTYESSTDDLRDLQRQVQRAESRYVREGCNDDAKAGRQLSRQCRQLATQITDGRDEVKDLQRSMQTGSAIAEQREAVLQEIARFNCSSRARVTSDEPRNIFEELFDAFGDGVDTREDDFYDYGYGGYGTVRTVCVRSCDGYFWPVSYSTLPEFAINDAQQCQAQCPGAEVDLYYYSNPGEEPEQMVSINGTPYSSTPNAFRYRTTYDASCTCKAPITYGSINIGQTALGQSRAVIQFGDLNFPLPLHDPRRPKTVVTAAPEATEVAEYVSVPLPRPRPKAPGQPIAVEPVAAAPETRIVKFGDKTVRVVGPDTPYVPKAAAGT